MFLLPDGQLLLNEVAPRPHNSGHYTQDGCVTSQFENHVRAILGWPLGDTSLNCGSSLMLNLLGEADDEEGVRLAHQLMAQAYKTPGELPQAQGQGQGNAWMCRKVRCNWHTLQHTAMRATPRTQRHTYWHVSSVVAIPL
jgi:hypothetical protein